MNRKKLIYCLEIVLLFLGLVWLLLFWGKEYYDFQDRFFWEDLTTFFRYNSTFLLRLKKKFLVLAAGCLLANLLVAICCDKAWNLKILGKKYIWKPFGKLTFILLSVILLLVILFDSVKTFSSYRNYKQTLTEMNPAKTGWEGDVHIAHANGSIGEDSYTNSLEAFESNYEKGVRTFEIDFAVTSDHELICWHWGEIPEICGAIGEITITKQEFMESRIREKYTPMSLETVVEKMLEHEDVWVVTDTKGSSAEQVQKEFTIFYNTIVEMGAEEVLDRFVVQLYNYEMLMEVEKIYSFPSYILTLYQMGGNDPKSFRKHCEYCKERGVEGITMWYYWATPELLEIAKEYDIKIYVHTLNELDEAKQLLENGVTGIYTDDLTPDEII